MTVILSPCPFCRHFRGDIRERNICSAFPEGIPREIIYGPIKHTEPYPGDNGIRFEVIEGFEEIGKMLERLDERRIANAN